LTDGDNANTSDGDGTANKTGTGNTTVGDDDGRDVTDEMEAVTNATGRVVELTSGKNAAGYALGGSGYVASVREDADNSRPVSLRTVVVNDGDEAAVYETDVYPPYDGVAENDRGDVLYAAPTEAHDLSDEPPQPVRDGDVWHINGSPTHATDAVPDKVELGSGDGYVGEYLMIADGEPADGFYVFGGEGITGLTLSVWTEGEPGPRRKPRFEGATFPDAYRLRGGRKTDSTRRWFHEANETTATYLRPSTEAVKPPATVRTRLVARSDRVKPTGNPSRWSLRKLADDEWVEVAGSDGTTAGSSLTGRPGACIADEIRVYHGEDGTDGETDGRAVGHLGGGRYAYTSGFSVDGEPLTTVFEVDAPALDVEPPEDAVSERDGAILTVTSGSYTDGDGARFVVERVEEADEPVVPEQLYNADEAIRYALPYFDGDVERVRVETDDATAGKAVVRPRNEDSRRFVYAGDAYRAELV
jgi:hypothetical protein